MPGGIYECRNEFGGDGGYLCKALDVDQVHNDLQALGLNRFGSVSLQSQMPANGFETPNATVAPVSRWSATLGLLGA